MTNRVEVRAQVYRQPGLPTQHRNRVLFALSPAASATVPASSPRLRATCVASFTLASATSSEVFTVQPPRANRSSRMRPAVSRSPLPFRVPPAAVPFVRSYLRETETRLTQRVVAHQSHGKSPRSPTQLSSPT
ncbi:unnamed protein product [Closterium sp. Yama58-4]|nr:unnamed protein product [Closterium sp. Yama58-4]